MNKPILTIVTGRPASGKTTLSHILAGEIRCPLLSRDEFKEGYLNSFQTSHDNVDHAAAIIIYETFFQTIELLLSKHISLVAEAAFQHKLWQPKIMSYLDIAIIRIVICEISPGLALTRYTNRFATDPSRERYHGDQAELAKETGRSLITSYIAPDIPVPTLRVDTTDKYDPGISSILAHIRCWRYSRFLHKNNKNTLYMKQEIQEYTIVTEVDIEVFLGQVQSGLQSGWQPFGGVSTLIDATGHIRYSQAMVKLVPALQG